MKASRVAAVFIAATLTAVLAYADGGRRSFKATLFGYEEVPAISSTGSGDFTLRLTDEETLEFELNYRDLEGTTTTAAHV